MADTSDPRQDSMAKFREVGRSLPRQSSTASEMRYVGRLLLRLVTAPIVRAWCRLLHRGDWYVRQWWIDDSGWAWMCRRCGEPWPLSKDSPRHQMTGVNWIGSGDTKGRPPDA